MLRFEVIEVQYIYYEPFNKTNIVNVITAHMNNTVMVLSCYVLLMFPYCHLQLDTLERAMIPIFKGVLTVDSVVHQKF